MSSNPPTRKPLKVQPKNNARRSKAERDAIEAAEAARRRARADAAAADAAAEASSRRAEYGLPSSDHRQNKWRDRGGLRSGRGGRGGFMGQSGPRIISRPAQLHAAASRAGGPARSSGGGGIESYAGSHRTSNIKREPGIRHDIDDDYAMLGIPGLKRDPDGGYMSSDPDEAELGPGLNIDHINLVSDEEEEDRVSEAPLNASIRAQRPRRVDGDLPIRLQRKEHKDRVVGINTEASSATAAALRKKAEETKKTHKAIPFDEALSTVTRKVKTRSKDLEVVSDKRRWRGVWEDGSEETAVKIKQEPLDDAMQVGHEPVDDDAEAQALIRETGPDAPRPATEPDSEDKAAIQAKLKKKSRSRGRPAMYQTAEELREWEKRQEELATLQKELGRIHVSTVQDADEAMPQQDNDVGNERQDSVYLFQLPSILPNLAEAAIKKEPISPTLSRAIKPIAALGPSTNDASTSVDVPIKIEDEDFGGDPSASRKRRQALASGWAGKLQVHRSGRATLTWGGTNMEMKMGVSPYFLQTAILTRMASDEVKGEATDNGTGVSSGAIAKGEAISFGQIRGKLVIVPAWSEILGERGLA